MAEAVRQGVLQRHWAACLLGGGLIVLSLLVASFSMSSVRQEKTRQGEERDGAQIFMRVCAGCHSLDLVRVRQMADDLDLSPAAIRTLLIEPPENWNAPLARAMDADSARQWFGIAPPDLSLTAQVRGSRWISRYLSAFYRDPTRSSGWNNRLVHDTAMPNVLWDLPQSFAQQRKGHLSPVMTREQTIARISAFLAYAADPTAHRRRMMAPWVIGFFCLFTVVVWLLQREYWRDIL